MNAKAIYDRAVKVLTVEEIEDIERKRSEEELLSELSEEQKDKWLEDPVTKRFLAFLNKERNTLLLLTEASGWSQDYLSVTGRSNLTQANTLRKVIAYASTGKYS